jgi:hypothetical protein
MSQRRTGHGKRAIIGSAEASYECGGLVIELFAAFCRRYIFPSTIFQHMFVICSRSLSIGFEMAL